MCKTISTIVLLMCALNSVCGLYFHIAETERKCFTEDVPDETTVIVNYKVELYDPRANGSMPSSPNIGMHVEVRDSDYKMILSRVCSSECRISFTSRTPAEHVICMYSNHSSSFSGAQLRVHLDIQVGLHTIDYADVAQKEKLSQMQLRIRQLLDQANQIVDEHYFQRYREEQFRQTCETINSRVHWCLLVQTIVLVVMAYLCKPKAVSIPVNNELDNTRHINVLRETWKKMHYPTETGTIMLILRLMAMYEKSNNKQEFLETLQSFQSVTVNSDQKICLLDEHFESQMEQLFVAFCNAFNTEEFALFTSSDAFNSLMSLIEANKREIAISPLADWMKKVSDLPVDEKAKIELDEYVDYLEINVVNFMFL